MHYGVSGGAPPEYHFRRVSFARSAIPNEMRATTALNPENEEANMKKVLFAVCAMNSMIFGKSVYSTTVTNLTTIKNYYGKQVIQVVFDPASAIQGTGCTYPGPGGMFFIMDMGAAGTAVNEFAKIQLALLMNAMATGTKVSLFGTSTCQGSEEFLQDIAVSP
jgi:hypothetical protein